MGNKSTKKKELLTEQLYFYLLLKVGAEVYILTKELGFKLNSNDLRELYAEAHKRAEKIAERILAKKKSD